MKRIKLIFLLFIFAFSLFFVGNIQARTGRVDYVIVEINGIPITKSSIEIWRKILCISEENSKDILGVRLSGGKTDTDIDGEIVSEIIKIHLLAEESSKYFQKLISPDLKLFDKIAYYTSPAYWLKPVVKNVDGQEKFPGDKKVLQKMEEQKKRLIVGLFGVPGHKADSAGAKALIYEYAKELDLTSNQLKPYLLKLALARGIWSFWGEDIKKASFVSPREIKNYYANHSWEFRNFKHFLVKKEGFNGNMTKAENLAMAISADLDNQISLNDLPINFQECSCAKLDDYIPEIKALLLKLRMNSKEVGLVKSGLGFHVVKLEPSKSLSESWDEISRKLQQQKIGAKNEELIRDLREKASIVFVNK